MSLELRADNSLQQPGSLSAWAAPTHLPAHQQELQLLTEQGCGPRLKDKGLIYLARCSSPAKSGMQGTDRPEF